MAGLQQLEKTGVWRRPHGPNEGHSKVARKDVTAYAGTFDMLIDAKLKALAGQHSLAFKPAIVTWCQLSLRGECPEDLDRM